MLEVEVDAERLALGAAVASAEALGAAELEADGLLAEGASVALGIGVLLMAPVFTGGADDITGGEVKLGTALVEICVIAIDAVGATED